MARCLIFRAENLSFWTHVWTFVKSDQTYGFCNVWACVWEGFVMCGCFDNCVSVSVICVLVFAVFCTVSFIYVYSYLFFWTSVRTTATEWKLIIIIIIIMLCNCLKPGDNYICIATFSTKNSAFNHTFISAFRLTHNKQRLFPIHHFKGSTPFSVRHELILRI
jgi:hypothetical protein